MSQLQGRVVGAAMAGMMLLGGGYFFQIYSQVNIKNVGNVQVGGGSQEQSQSVDNEGNFRQSQSASNGGGFSQNGGGEPEDFALLEKLTKALNATMQSGQMAYQAKVQELELVKQRTSQLLAKSGAYKGEIARLRTQVIHLEGEINGLRNDLQRISNQLAAASRKCELLRSQRNNAYIMQQYEGDRAIAYSRKADGLQVALLSEKEQKYLAQNERDKAVLALNNANVALENSNRQIALWKSASNVGVVVSNPSPNSGNAGGPASHIGTINIINSPESGAGGSTGRANIIINPPTSGPGSSNGGVAIPAE